MDLRVNRPAPTTLRSRKSLKSAELPDRKHRDAQDAELLRYKTSARAAPAADIISIQIKECGSRKKDSGGLI
jgi:hypothetical protein